MEQNEDNPAFSAIKNPTPWPSVFNVRVSIRQSKGGFARKPYAQKLASSMRCSAVYPAAVNNPHSKNPTRAQQEFSIVETMTDKTAESPVTLKTILIVLCVLAVGVSGVRFFGGTSHLFLAIVFVFYYPLIYVQVFLPLVTLPAIRSYPAKIPLPDAIMYGAFYISWAVSAYLFDFHATSNNFTVYLVTIALLAACLFLAVHRTVQQANAKGMSLMSSFKQWTNKHKFLVGMLGLVVGLPALFFLTIELPSRVQFAMSKSQLATIEQQVIIPSGGQVQRDVVEIGGGGFQERNSCGFFIGCSEITKEWAVPVEGTNQEALAQDIFKKAGYVQVQSGCRSGNAGRWYCDMAGERTGLKLSIRMEPASPKHKELAEKDVTPRVWAYVHVKISPKKLWFR